MTVEVSKARAVLASNTIMKMLKSKEASIVAGKSFYDFILEVAIAFHVFPDLSLIQVSYRKIVYKG